MSFNMMGTGVSYLIGPLAVPYEDDLAAANKTEVDQMETRYQKYIFKYE